MSMLACGERWSLRGVQSPVATGVPPWGGKVASPCSGTLLGRGAQRVGSKALRLWLNVPRRHVRPPRDGGHCSGGVVMVGSMKSSSSTCTGHGETSSLSVVVVTAREGWSLRGVQSPPPTAALAMAHRAAFRHGGPCREWVVIYENLECVRCARRPGGYGLLVGAGGCGSGAVLVEGSAKSRSCGCTS